MTRANIPKLDISVVGAGIAGLAVAIALARHGHKTRVLERAEALGDVGAGIQISPNGMFVLDALGLGDRLRAVALPMGQVTLRDGFSDRRVVGLELAQPLWVAHRADLIALLETAAVEAGVQIATAQNVEPPQDGAALSGGDLLIGADGVRSKMRAGIEGAGKPDFTGQVAWRAIVPEEQAASGIEVFMAPGQHVVSYPLAGGRRNIVAVSERQNWTEEGWRHSDTPANLQAEFATFGGAVPEWLSRVETVHRWGLFLHPVARQWHHGQQVLIGDAAHAMLPFLAQGANMALEDAWVLADLLGAYPPETALAKYQAARLERVTRVAAASAKNARNYHLRGLSRRIGHLGMRMVGSGAPGMLTRRFDWLYEQDVTKTLT